jgi:hypothetical protein
MGNKYRGIVLGLLDGSLKLRGDEAEEANSVGDEDMDEDEDEEDPLAVERSFRREILDVLSEAISAV